MPLSRPRISRNSYRVRAASKRVALAFAAIIGASIVFALVHYLLNGREDRVYPAFVAASLILSVVAVVSAFETSWLVGVGLLATSLAWAALIWFTLRPVAHCVTRVLEGGIL